MNRRMEVLQTSALPLGYGAECNKATWASGKVPVKQGSFTLGYGAVFYIIIYYA